jgi:hypothetical protein
LYSPTIIAAEKYGYDNSTMTNIAPAVEEDMDILTANDRCDKCGSQAYVLVIFPEDKALMFCSHHWNENSAKLLEVAVDIIDETDKLSRK